jgi:hypothetical protein
LVASRVESIHASATFHGPLKKRPLYQVIGPS